MPTHDLLLFAISFFVSYVMAFCFTRRQQNKCKTCDERGSVVIPREAFLCEVPDYICGDDQRYLYVLQKNGVPISGIFYLQLDRRLVYTVQKEPDDLSVRVEWRMKK